MVHYDMRLEAVDGRIAGLEDSSKKIGEQSYKILKASAEHLNILVSKLE